MNNNNKKTGAIKKTFDAAIKSINQTDSPTEIANGSSSKSQDENTTFQYSQSTINESSLMITPASSTLRGAISGNRKQFRESISHLKKMLQTDTNTEDIINKFTHSISISNPVDSIQSDAFQHSKGAEAQLLADEISWRNKFDIPVMQSESLFSETVDTRGVSIGEFFKQRSDSFPDFTKTNLTSNEPIALLDSSTNITKNSTIKTTDIQALLSDDAKSADSILSTLLKHKSKKSICTTEDPSLGKVSSSTACSTLTSLLDDKLPIHTTKQEVVWGCVKIDKSITKDFLIRNKSSKTFRVQCSVTNPDFKIKSDYRSDSDLLSTCKFVLHGHETKLLCISYKASFLGPSLDKLEFSPLDSYLVQTKKQVMKLWAYGGHIEMKYQGVTRDNTGKYWLSLGRLDDRMYMNVLEHSFVIQNTGSLKACVFIQLLPKYLISMQNIKIVPNSFLLAPNDKQNVSITYHLNARDTRLLKDNFKNLPVFDIGKIEIISCPQITRARLNRLTKSAKEQNLNINPLSYVLMEPIAQEEDLYELKLFKEGVSSTNMFSISELLQTVNTDEMIITIEHDPNQTLCYESEDSIAFQSIMQDSPVISGQPKCQIEPSIIILVPNEKLCDCFYLSSDSSKDLNYTVHVISDTDSLTEKYNECIKITPTTGIIGPKQTAILRVNLIIPVENIYKVVVCIEGKSYDLKVKVLNVK